MANKKFFPGQTIKFKKDGLVYEVDNNESYKVKKGSKGTVVEDKDAGEIGSCWLQIEKKKGEKVIVRTDDNNLEERQ